MDKLTSKSRISITVVVTLLVWGHIIWDYFHGGIPVHYVLHDDALPGIPNWVGGLVLPFFTWFLLYRIHRRMSGFEMLPASERLNAILKRFLLSLSIALSISVFFSLQIDIIDYIMLGIIVLALFYPLYKSEYLLGWVLGSSFTFGAIIPIVFGSILALMLFIVYKLSTFVVGFVKTKR